MNKYDKEMEILNKIFNDKSIKITKSEQPDFLLGYGNNVLVGVEITELYYNESSARLKNVPNYADTLIEKERFLHKNDKENLKVEPITYFPQSNLKNPIQTKVILTKKSSMANYINVFTERLLDKHNKHKKYKENLDYYLLIIYDCESHYRNIKKIEFAKNFFSKEMLKNISSSPFDEIHLITQIENKEVYIPLKFHYMIDLAYKLLTYTSNNNLKDKLAKLTLDYEDALYELLILNGFKESYFYIYENKKIVANKNYGIHFKTSSNFRVEIEIFNSYPIKSIPNYTERVKNKKKFFNKKQHDDFLRKTDNSVSRYNIGFDVKKDG